MDGTGVPDHEAVPGPGFTQGSSSLADHVETEAVAPSPTWAELTALPPSARSGFKLGWFGLVLMLGALALLAVVAGIAFTFQSQRGQVMFTTVDPNGGNSCIVTNRVTTVNRGTHAWMVVVFKSSVGTDQMSLQFRKNGAYVGAYAWPAEAGSEKANCTWSEDLASYEPGTWTFTILRNGTVEAEGTLSIK